MAEKELQEELDNYICDRSVKQVLSHLDQKPFEELDIWTMRISSKLVGPVTNRLKALLPREPHSLVHVRRVKMVEGDQDQDPNRAENGLREAPIVRIVICTKDCVPDIQDLVCIFEKQFPDLDVNALEIQSDTVSKYPGYTKNQNSHWQEKGGWPLIWRGNPKAKKVEVPSIEQEQCMKYLRQVVELSKSIDASVDAVDLPIATLIVDPSKDKVLVSAIDKRNSSGDPIRHSIMVAALEAANLEAEKRRETEAQKKGPLLQDQDDRNYLCLNLHVYTTHEPCIMCAMALIHSRIARLVYIRDSPLNGGIEPTSGAGYSVHSHKKLNWSYESWRWVGHDEEVSAPELADSICA